MHASVLVLVVALASCVFGQSYSASAVSENDVKVLNYALFLERLESAFYNKFQAQFTATQFTNAGINSNVYAHLDVIKAHEAAHVDFLTNALGSSAIAGGCTYDFSSVTDPISYVKTAKALEGAGVSAYDGALSYITNRQFALAAATIATVEARHAGYLYNLTTNLPIDGPFPNAFDSGVNQADTTTLVVKLFNPTGCPVPATFAAIPVVPVQSTLTFSNNTVITPTQALLDANDVKTLQYALVLEHLEANFYNTYVPLITDWPSATVQAFFGLIRDHENTHVSALTSALSEHNPVKACPSYNFNVTSVGPVTNFNTFIQVSKILENTGVSAYDGAVRSLTGKSLLDTAATIATVEARHAAFVNDLLAPTDGSAPFPGNTGGAFDNALNVTQVFAAVAPIITNGGQVCGGADLSVAQPAVYTNLLPTATPTSAPTKAPSTGAGVAVSASVVAVIVAAAFALVM